MKKRSKILKHAKASLIAGTFIGIGLKLRDSYLVRSFACGMDGHICSAAQFLKELFVWIIFASILVMTIVFGIKFLLKYLIVYIKNFKFPKIKLDDDSKRSDDNKKNSKKQETSKDTSDKKEDKKDKKESKDKKEEPEEIIKI